MAFLLPWVDWLTRRFAELYERGSTSLPRISLPAALAKAPLLDVATVPELPSSVSSALSCLGVHGEVLDMDGVIPSILGAWLVVSLVLRWIWPADKPEPPKLHTGSYWLSRVAFLHCLGGVYLTAFLVAVHQNPALLGEEGLLPASAHMKQLRAQLLPHRPKEATVGNVWPAFIRAPGLLWFILPGGEDRALAMFALLGVALSALLLVRGAGNMPLLVTLWMLYMSISMVGQRWYSFGWESQLLETGFLAIFLSPLVSLAALPKHVPTPTVTRWAYIWLLFRIMLGAGLIKIRGDQCWRDLTCMDYHYETQPVPNPVAWFLHSNYPSFHKFEVLVNHFVELVAPWLLLPILPRACMLLGGVIQILFQGVLIISGNLSFLNWLTALPALFCFDDRFLVPLFSSTTCRRVDSLQQLQQLQLQQQLQQHPPPPPPQPQPQPPVDALGQQQSRSRSRSPSPSPLSSSASSDSHVFLNSRTCAHCLEIGWRATSAVVSLTLGVTLLYLSMPVIRNLLQLDGRQAMNSSFNSWKILNTYGAFGSITKTRTEIILEGTLANDPNAENAVWLEYEFKCKPGNVTRTPCAITPYHYRLDWLMWFAAFGNYQQHPWLLYLVAKLLSKDRDHVASLLATEGDPFATMHRRPRYIRGRHFEYHYTNLTEASFGSTSPVPKVWWKRKPIGEYFPPLSLDNPSLRHFIEGHGWTMPAGK